MIRFRDTERAGPYRFKAAGSEVAVAAVAVQMDPKESDLRVLSAEKVAALTGVGRSPVPPAAAPAPGASAVSAGVGTRRELWLPLVVCAVVVALIEMALAQRFSIIR